MLHLVRAEHEGRPGFDRSMPTRSSTSTSSAGARSGDDVTLIPMARAVCRLIASVCQEPSLAIVADQVAERVGSSIAIEPDSASRPGGSTSRNRKMFF
jgi:hypothetical protein